MFQQITMIDYGRPLPLRRDIRRVCGNYKWTPSRPGSGRGFYQDNDRLAVDARGSTFRLRLEPANDHLRGSRLAQTRGYFCDVDGDCALTPIVARLPHGRGFLAGWTMGKAMAAALDGDIWPDAEEAARAAHGMAERDAERERDSQAGQVRFCPHCETETEDDGDGDCNDCGGQR